MKKFLLIAVGFGLLVPQLSLAEDVNKIFTKVNNYISAGNYPKALEELSWARKEVEKMHNTKLQTLLPDSLAGYTCQKGTSQSAMGISQIEKNCSKDSSRVKIFNLN